MAYKSLTQDEQDDLIVATLQAQEVDDYVHRLNLDRFDAMLLTLPAGPFRDRIQGLRDETASRIDEVERILAALDPQLPSQGRINAAKGRLIAAAANANATVNAR